MLTGGGAGDTVGPGIAVKRRRRREQMEEEDSSDLSDDSEDEGDAQDVGASRAYAERVKASPLVWYMLGRLDHPESLVLTEDDYLAFHVAIADSRPDTLTGTDDAVDVREANRNVIPPELLRLYDKLRGQFGGIGAARLYQKRCEGCRLELNITELAEVRSAPSDQVVRCENCRRILIRTPESGI